MIRQLVELLRGRSVDRSKGHAYVTHQADYYAREAMAEYDSFVPVMADVREPSFLLGSARDSQGNAVAVKLGCDEFPAHWLLQGGTGTGKTSFVTSLLARSLSLGCPVGIVDCKSGLFDAALSWMGAHAYTLAPADRDAFMRDLVVINPFGDSLIPLNVCSVLPGGSAETQAFDVTLTFGRLFDEGVSFRMASILRHLLLLLSESNLTLVESGEILQNDLLRNILVERSSNPIIKEFFFRDYPGMPNASKEALLARLNALLLSDNVRCMLGANECIDFREVFRRGSPVVAFLGKGPGIPEEQVELIGSLLLQMIFQRAYALGDCRSRPYQLFLDEFFHLLEAPELSKRFDRALTSLRSFGVHLALVMHNFTQVSPALRETILGNCDHIAVFRTSAHNAQAFGEFMPEYDPNLERRIAGRGRKPGRSDVRRLLVEQLQRLPNRTYYWYDRTKPYRALRVKVPTLREPHESVGLTEAALNEFIEQHGLRRGGWAVPKTILRQQIADRRERLALLSRPAIRVETEAPPDPVPTTTTTRRRKPRLG